MKNKLMILASCVLLLCATGCKKDKNKKDDNTPISNSETLVGKVSAPTWTASSDYDYNSSMTAVVRIDLAEQFPDRASDFELTGNDVLAAFIDGQCVGVSKPEEGLFFLFITEPVTTGSNRQVTLRYYSVHYKNLFEATNVFPFENDARQGTVTEPYVPELKVGE